MTSNWVKFRDTVEAIIGIGAQFVLPIVGIVGLVPGIPASISSVLKIIPSLMAAFEQAIPAPGSGPVKKAAVLATTKSIMDVLDKQVLTGGAKASYDTLLPVITAIVDSTITTVNQVAPQIIADDNPTDPLIPIP